MESKYLRIFHMASFSRSGETLMLRSLNAHPNIHVVHNLKHPEDTHDFALFRRLQLHDGDQISANDPDILKASIKPTATCLVVKNAVWEHKYAFNGFILARNPLAVYQSFGIIDESDHGYSVRRAQFSTWLKMIDPVLIPALEDGDNTTMFCLLFLRKMFPLVSMPHLPVLHYERFVESPERYLRLLAAHLHVPYNERMLNSHLDYQEGDVGHGRIKLWRPINKGSLDKYKRIANSVRSKVWGLTFPAAGGLGYNYDGESVQIDSAFNDRFNKNLGIELTRQLC